MYRTVFFTSEIFFRETMVHFHNSSLSKYSGWGKPTTEIEIYLSSYSAIRPRGHFRQLRAVEQC